MSPVSKQSAEALTPAESRAFTGRYSRPRTRTCVGCRRFPTCHAEFNSTWAGHRRCSRCRTAECDLERNRMLAGYPDGKHFELKRERKK